MKKRESASRRWPFWATPIIAIAVVTLLYLFTPFALFERRLYDLFLSIKPSVTQDPSLLFLEVDDSSIAKEGTWPWSRDKMADALVVLKEFGALNAVFDIEYTEKSPLHVNSNVLTQELPDELKAGFSSISGNATDLLNAVKQHQLPVSQMGPFISQLDTLSQQTQAHILDKVTTLTRNNDDYLGQAAKVFGHAFFTINTLDYHDPGVSETLRQQAIDRFSLKDVSALHGFYRPTVDIRPSIWPILSQGEGAGFPSVHVDRDGVRRRIDLLESYRGHEFAQLGFVALLSELGNPQILAYPHHLVLKQAHWHGVTKDIVIPLDANSRMLINWPHESFDKSFRHLPFYDLLLPQVQEQALMDNLQAMQQAGYLAYATDPNFLQGYQEAQAMRQKALSTGDTSAMTAYAVTRVKFFQNAKDFLEGNAEQRLMADINAALATPGITPDQTAQMQGARQDAQKIFHDTRAILDKILELRATLQKALSGSFCIIGNTATSTTDLGVTPFDNKYMNVGTHAAVVNTILSGQFLSESPGWLSVLVGALLALGLAFRVRRSKPGTLVISGFAVVVLIVAVSLLIFVLMGLYIPILAPVLMVFVTFLALAMTQFLSIEKEKSFYRTAFGHYLSSAVINDLLDNPEKLKLGGEKKELSALFTDIQGFSSISELLDPEDLVKLLNLYLTTMSDIILDLSGTIDKYEGDAIIAFFGAPVDLSDHARRAALTAIRMKRAEGPLNEYILKNKLSPRPLVTRIGVNSGEMVVGNMGTVKKMDYTIMGNAVNLASRLEGVNKQYGTGILTGEITCQQLGGEFLTRQLDRVRVVGISNPVRLYEIVEETSAATDVQKQKVELFHSALLRFEAKDWTGAEKGFLDVLQLDPHDGPALFFRKRCVDFQHKQPAENWDGVFNLTAK
ncbi:MAG: CHASE2 domain-containing protein [Spirochaetales bacterium]|nr:CHASE2 domain-containing protein [Spirochaetales bacterium]